MLNQLERAKVFVAVLALALVSGGCAHLQTDDYPLGLGSHHSYYVSIPSNVGGSLGLVVGVPLTLALSPITVPLGFLVEGSGGAFVFFVAPAVGMGYGVGTVFGTVPYFTYLPFENSPLYSDDPGRRYRAIEVARENGDRESLPRLMEMVEKETKVENQQAAARALGDIRSPAAFKLLLDTLVHHQNTGLRVQCFKSLKKYRGPEVEETYIKLTDEKSERSVKMGLLLLSHYATKKGVDRLIEMLDGPYKNSAWRILQKKSGKKWKSDPSIWRKWADNEFPN